MAAEKINILIVDDSLAVRALLRKVLEGDPYVDEIYSASNGKIGLEFHQDKKPDILILDMNMPEKNGLEVISELRKKSEKTPVILFSTAGQAPETIKALSYDNVDFLSKDEQTDKNFSSNLEQSVLTLKNRLLPKIYQFFKFSKNAESKTSPVTTTSNSSLTPSNTISGLSQGLKLNFELPRFKTLMNPRPEAVVIASSTGGPKALEELLKNLSQFNDFGPIFITQHMPPHFTAQLADHLSKKSGLKIQEGRHNEVVQRNHIYIAPGGYHMELLKESETVLKIVLHQKELRHSVRPSVEFLFETASAIFKNRLLAIVLTGMGEDGIDGARLIKKNYGKIITQSPDSCAVYGMPRAVDEAKLTDGSEHLEVIRSVLIENFLKK